MANLDGSGFSPEKDRLGTKKRKHYGIRSAPLQRKLLAFAYKNRIKIMPTIFGDGSCAKPAFILRSQGCGIVSLTESECHSLRQLEIVCLASAICL